MNESGQWRNKYIKKRNGQSLNFGNLEEEKQSVTVGKE